MIPPDLTRHAPAWPGRLLEGLVEVASDTGMRAGTQAQALALLTDLVRSDDDLTVARRLMAHGGSAKPLPAVLLDALPFAAQNALTAVRCAPPTSPPLHWCSAAPVLRPHCVDSQQTLRRQLTGAALVSRQQTRSTGSSPRTAGGGPPTHYHSQWLSSSCFLLLLHRLPS
jgi:hypothetical protein